MLALITLTLFIILCIIGIISIVSIIALYYIHRDGIAALTLQHQRILQIQLDKMQELGCGGIDCSIPEKDRIPDKIIQKVTN